VQRRLRVTWRALREKGIHARVDGQLRAAGIRVAVVSTVQVIEKAIGQLPWPQRLKVYRDLPDLIGRTPEDLDWQRAGLENFFADDSPEDEVFDSL
jgi:hypothetical protein